MKAVLQRVVSARVEVEGRIVSQIGPGLLVLVGVHDSDGDKDAEYMCRKILNTRIFQNGESGKPWDLSVMQKGFEVLLVSQFTLYGMLKGNKLDFHVAMPPERAKTYYESFVQRVKGAYKSDAVRDGLFGAMMQVHIQNDGPVTIQLDSRKETTADLNQSAKSSRKHRLERGTHRRNVEGIVGPRSGLRTGWKVCGDVSQRTDPIFNSMRVVVGVAFSKRHLDYRTNRVCRATSQQPRRVEKLSRRFSFASRFVCPAVPCVL